jgi:hypothetical protein
MVNNRFELAEFSGIIVSHQVFVNEKWKGYGTSSHLKVAEPLAI